MNYQQSKARRAQLIEEIAQCADEIQRIDNQLPILYSQALEADLLQAEEQRISKLGVK